MLHVPASMFAGAEPAPPIVRAPLSPAEYLRLRREAAGLSVERVVALLMPNPVDRVGARAFLRLIETKGARVSDSAALQLLQRAFPFDVDVYWQLALDPADRHPAVCRTCASSSWDRTNLCEGCQPA